MTMSVVASTTGVGCAGGAKLCLEHAVNRHDAKPNQADTHNSDQDSD